MSIACVTCLSSIIHSAPLPLAMVMNGTITVANKRLGDLLGQTAETLNGTAPASLLPGLGLEGIIPDALQRNRPHSLERTTAIAGRQASLWVQVLPVTFMPEKAALVSVIETSAVHWGQVALLQQMRKARTDNIWIFNESLHVVYADLEPELQLLRAQPNFEPLRLLQPGQAAEARRALRAAKANPGKQVSVTLRAQRDDNRLITVYADIIFFIDILSNYYLCCTRTRELRGSGIITRLKEAFGVYTDIELAKLLGTSPAMLSRARHGHKPPGDWVVKAWQDSGVSADWLLTGRGNKF